MITAVFRVLLADAISKETFDAGGTNGSAERSIGHERMAPVSCRSTGDLSATDS
jgi:hypothetical protein